MTEAFVGVGSAIAGIGLLILLSVISYMIWQFIRTVRSSADIVEAEDIIVYKLLCNIAKEKGIDLEMELIKRQIFQKDSKDIRKKLRQQVYEEFIGGKIK